MQIIPGAYGHRGNSPGMHRIERQVTQVIKKALVVDNDFFFVEFLTELLEARDYAVSKAYDGKQGMEQLDSGPYGVMFADIVMPKVDGGQLIKYVRQRFPERPFPVVAVSGTVIELMDDLDKIGADYYIAKGPLEKMKAQFNGFIEKIEAGPSCQTNDCRVFDMGRIYPRRESVELIESLNFQRSIMECIGMGVIVVDRDAKIISCNAGALDLMETDEVATLNKKIHLLFPPPERAKLVDALRRIARKPSCRRIALELTPSEKPLRFVVSLLAYNGENIGWIVALEDLEQWDTPV